MIQLADPEELRRLISNPDQLGNLLPVLNRCCFMINQSFKKTLSAIIKDKSVYPELDNEFAKSASLLQSRLIRELCACYGDQLYTMLDTKEKAMSMPDDPSDQDALE